MKLLANALTCLLLLAVLASPTDAAVSVRSPAFTFTGTYTLALLGAHNATLTLDTGQTAQFTAGGSSLTITGVPDGLRTWHLTYTSLDGQLGELEGEFTSQDLTPLIAAQLARSVQASRDAHAAALATQNTTNAILNVTQQVGYTAQQALEAAKAIHVPEDLTRRGDLQELAAMQGAQLASLSSMLEQAAHNQTRTLEEAHHELQTFRSAASFVVGLLLLGLGLLAVYLARLRSELGRLTPAPSPSARPPRAVPASPEEASASRSPPPATPPQVAEGDAELARCLVDSGGADAD